MLNGLVEKYIAADELLDLDDLARTWHFRVELVRRPNGDRDELFVDCHLVNVVLATEELLVAHRRRDFIVRWTPRNLFKPERARQSHRRGARL